MQWARTLFHTAALLIAAVTVLHAQNELAPNPVVDELSIAWRGDLKQMPTRFEVHDLLGNRVASGTVEPYLGAARWHCAGRAAGTYLLTAFDHDGAVIATATIIKQ